MVKKLILVNGPQGSGKDEFCNWVEENYSGHGIVWTAKQAEPLHMVAHYVFDCLEPDFPARYDLTQERKNRVNEELGMSYRQFCIEFSESFMKPNFGQEIFGKILAGRLRGIAGSDILSDEKMMFLISDSGFEFEAVPLIEEFGAENILLVKLVREGHNFIGDSRSYINLDLYGINTIYLKNESLDKFHNEAISIVTEFMKSETANEDPESLST